MEEAILYVMKFYDTSREEVIENYWDEVEAYMYLVESGLIKNEPEN